MRFKYATIACEYNLKPQKNKQMQNNKYNCNNCIFVESTKIN